MIGRYISLTCAWLGHHCRLWPIVCYYVIAGALAGLWHLVEGLEMSLVPLVAMLILFVVMPILLVSQRPRLWCRVPTAIDLKFLISYNHLA